MNYIDVTFLQKEIKEKSVAVVESEEDSHYAEVVCLPNHHKPPTAAKPQIAVMVPEVPEETLYRLKEDHRFEKPKIQAKVGDIFLSKNKEKDGHIVGDLLKVTSKNNYHTNVSIPVEKLIIYSPGSPAAKKTANTMLSSPSTNRGIQKHDAQSAQYVDMADIKTFNSGNSEIETLSSFVPELEIEKNKYILQVPTSPSPPLEKVKIFSKEKFGKLMSEWNNIENEVIVFAVADRKSNFKEKGVCSFKRKQIAILIYASQSRWWLVKGIDGSLSGIGWVPGDYWRILPQSIDDDYSHSDHIPWLVTGREVSDCQNSLSLSGKDKNFIFIKDKQEETYHLILKRSGEVFTFTVNIMPSKNLILNGRNFQTLQNLVLYSKKISLSATDPQCNLGLPFVMEI